MNFFTEHWRFQITTSDGSGMEMVKRTVSLLVAVRDAEQRSLVNTPDNFQCSDSFETGEQAVDVLDEVIDLLETAC